MLLGTIQGKTTTNAFTFLAKEEPRNLDYVQVYHKVYGYVLCQITEITKQSGKTQASCQVIGYRDEQGRIKRPRIPFDENTEVLKAEDEYIKAIISIPTTADEAAPHATIGRLDGKDIPISINLNTVLTKHVAVLAKSGAGKSYTVGVLLEEIAERGVPMVIIDPHGEYASLASPNNDEEQQAQLARYELQARGYNVAEYADTSLNPQAKPLLLGSRLTAQELTHLLPGKLSANQQAVLYSALKNLRDVTFDNLLYELENEESPAKYNIISTVEYLRSLPIFSAHPVPYNELVKSGQATVINLKGITPDVQEIVVYKLCKDLFALRKQNKVSPFFLVIEEAHNYCVAEKTQITTSKGKEKISRLSSELVVSLNHQTHALEQEPMMKRWPKRPAETLKLISETGRELECTPDHPLFAGNDYVPASEADVFLIPLKSSYPSQEKLILSRLFGALLSDGWLSRNGQAGFSGKKTDVQSIKEDLSRLDLRSSNVFTFRNKRASTVKKSTGEILRIMGEGSSINCSMKAFKKFKALGAPVGERVTQKSSVPSWILKGNRTIKAEFLGGLMGGDGDRPSLPKLNCYAIRLYFSKIEELQTEAEQYAKQLMQLFSDLGVKTILSRRNANTRKRDNKKTIKYIISINNDDKNLMTFFERIGYRYNAEKENLSKQMLSYLKKKQFEIKQREKLRSRALELKKEGFGKIKIARMLGTYSSLVAKWIYPSYNTTAVSLSKNSFPTYEEWKKQNCDDEYVRERIIKKEKLGERFVYNITTNNANYLANGILVHNCPERSFGETKASKVLRDLASEGRKFGLGLCVVSQRPARVDKSVLSQCSTQIILKVTNPNDLRAIAASVEGLTAEAEAEIKNLPVGTALVTGIADVPLFVAIRPRKTMHGGHAIDVLGSAENPPPPELFGAVEEFKDQELLPLIKPAITPKDLEVMSQQPLLRIDTILTPAFQLHCKEGEQRYTLLVEAVGGSVVTDKEEYSAKALPALDKLTPGALAVLQALFAKGPANKRQLAAAGNINVEEDLQLLQEEGYIIAGEKGYAVSDRYIFTKLSKAASYDQVSYEQLPYDEKQTARLSIDDVKRKYGRFTTILDHNDCYLVSYKPVPQAP